MINRKFFEESDNFAYIIGLLLADGSIWIKHTTKSWYGNLSLGLKKSDEYLVKQVRNFIDPDITLLTYKKHGTFIGQDTAYINVTNKEVLTRVLSYGVVPRKTRIVSLPDMNKYNYSLIRGIFDGDGSVWKYDQGKNFGLGLRTTFTGGCRNFLVQIGNLLKEDIGIIPKIYEASCGNDNWRLQYGARESLALYEYMYQNDPEIYHRDRKNIFETWIDYKGIRDIYKAECKKCGNPYIRIRREKNFCNECYKKRRNKSNHKNKI